MLGWYISQFWRSIVTVGDVLDPAPSPLLPAELCAVEGPLCRLHAPLLWWPDYCGHAGEWPGPWLRLPGPAQSGGCRCVCVQGWVLAQLALSLESASPVLGRVMGPGVSSFRVQGALVLVRTHWGHG